MILSIIICTHNRSFFLNKVLVDLIKLNQFENNYEIIIVDNNSKDSTKEIAQEFIAKQSNIRYFFEPNVGLSNSRNRGWQEAFGDYVAYIDDDCRVTSDWLEKAYQIIRDYSPIAFGGPYFPLYLSQKPKWYKDEYGTFMKGNYPKQPNPVEDFYLCGGNFLVNKNVFKEIGGFNPKLGMNGASLGYSEENELQDRIRVHYPEVMIYFDPNLFIKHYVRPEKMKIIWRFNQQYKLGSSEAIIKSNLFGEISGFKFLIEFIIIILIIIKRLIKGFLFRNRKKYPYFHNWLYEDFSTNFYLIGHLYQRLKFVINN